MIKITITSKSDRQELTQVDAISLTANTAGFTVCNAVLGNYGKDEERLKVLANKCNLEQKVMYAADVKPNLIFVPKINKTEDVTNIIEDVVKAANVMAVKRLRFTHYMVVFDKLPEQQIATILDCLLDKDIATTLEEVVIEIDKKFKRKLQQMLEQRTM